MTRSQSLRDWNSLGLDTHQNIVVYCGILVAKRLVLVELGDELESVEWVLLFLNFGSFAARLARGQVTGRTCSMMARNTSTKNFAPRLDTSADLLNDPSTCLISSTLIFYHLQCSASLLSYLTLPR